MSVETNLQRFRRKRIEKQFRNALSNQKLVLDDGSGQMVGVYDQSSGKEMNTEMNQRLEQERMQRLEQERMKELAKRKRITQELQSKKPSTDSIKDSSPQEVKQKQKQKWTEEEEGVAKGIISALDSDSSKKSSADEGPPAGGEEAALNNAMQAGIATGGNPYAMAGAAAIGILTAEQERERYKQKKLEEADLAKAESKEAESKIYSKLATSMRGILT